MMKPGVIGVIVLVVVLGAQGSVECVVASEWSLAGPADDYTMAWINVTYVNPNTGQLHSENGEVGKFGMGKVASASGLVVHVRSKRSSDGKINHYGCEPLEGPLPDRPWIALIKRGNCNFDRKLENAQARNAVAMVVYDLEDKENLEKMGLSNCRNCSIPGIFTFKRIGEELANIIDNGTRVEMIITVGEQCSRPYSGINRTSVLFVSISFIVLMIISLAWLVFYYVQRFRYLHAKDRLAQRLCNAAKKALAKIPTRNIKMTDKEITGEAECCAVCIEYYASGDVLRTLPCRHEFHKMCVDPWLLEHRTCPMCKMDILKYYGFIFTGSQESILHLDEDGNLASSDSRDTESATHEGGGGGGGAPLHPVRYAEPPEHPHSSSTPPSHAYLQQLVVDETVRKPSLISLTVVAAPRNQPQDQFLPKLLSPGNGFECKCSCTCDKSAKTQPAPPDHQQTQTQQHPMCYAHHEDQIQRHHKHRQSNQMEDSDTGREAPPGSPHQPLIIHRDNSPSSQSKRKLSSSRDHIPPYELEPEQEEELPMDQDGGSTPTATN